VFNADVNAFPMRTQSPISPRSCRRRSSDYDQKGVRQESQTFTAFAQEHCSGSHALYALKAMPRQGPGHAGESEGWDGNYFNSWNRAANQFEAYPTFQFAPKVLAGMS